MKTRSVWLAAFLVVALLVAGCGPQMATPTPRSVEPTVASTTAAQSSPTAAQSSPTATAGQPTPTAKPLDLGGVPVDPNDWRALGSADAPVTFVEYSDFQ